MKTESHRFAALLAHRGTSLTELSIQVFLSATTEYLNMAKAHLKTKSGATVVIEGTPAEVASLMKQLEGEPSTANGRGRRQARRKTPDAPGKATPINLIGTLIDSGFFRKPKDLASVKAALEELGHHYPITSLSPTLLRLVRKRQLRRLRDKKRWTYTG